MVPESRIGEVVVAGDVAAVVEASVVVVTGVDSAVSV